ncbi:hypothetical protein OS493_029047 [Desmophyllum pertusum]|uniref:Uncharacterized protein n=1 Tax=Desmophyllum pertusum TaxID=174260 RepID=A0A9W9YNH5_9CNID|nr:hypothetical protein OS493_029047 [Desmophyllum pertusum]
MSGALSCLLGCQATKLRNVANVGFLTELCSRLLSLQLQKGWGNLWGQLSKLSTALGYHQDHESHVAVLIFLRRQCVPDDNWHWFLQSDDRAMEQRLHQTTFTGCFVEAMQERAGEATPVGDSAEENLLRRHQVIHRGVRKVDAKSALHDLWVACRADCMCLGTPAGVDASSSSQASQDVNCPYVLCSKQGV